MSKKRREGRKTAAGKKETRLETGPLRARPFLALKRSDPSKSESPARPAPSAPEPSFPSAPTPSSPDPADDDDARARYRYGAAPIGNRRVPVTGDAERRAHAQPTSGADDASRARLAALAFGDLSFEFAFAGGRVNAHRADAPRGIVRALSRAELPIDARLDVHGLKEHECAERVTAFVRSAREQGERCLLIITGKGAGSPGQVGVLRASLPDMLASRANLPHVWAFSSAPEELGGEGALLVLLAPRRFRA